MICGHGDQRMVKESMALKRNNHSVSLLTRSPNAYNDFFDQTYIFSSDEKMGEYLKTLEADIYHIHCKPASIPRIAIQVLLERKKKFIYDVHDLDIVRFEKTNSDELFALLNSPYLIFPEEAVKEKTFELLLKHLPKKPKSLVLLPYFSLMDMVYPLVHPVPLSSEDINKKIVYEGNIIYPMVETIKAFPYYDYRFVAFIFSSYGYEFHIYPVGIDFNQARQVYDGSGAILHAPVDYPALIREMGAFGWGFFGSFSKNVQADITFANKIFDYICAGIPVMVMNAAKMGKWLEETGFGLEIKSFDDIEKIKEDRTIRENLQQNILGGRVGYSMEENIGRLEDFYKEILDDSNFYQGIEGEGGGEAEVINVIRSKQEINLREDISVD